MIFGNFDHPLRFIIKPMYYYFVPLSQIIQFFFLLHYSRSYGLKKQDFFLLHYSTPSPQSTWHHLWRFHQLLKIISDTYKFSISLKIRVDGLPFIIAIVSLYLKVLDLCLTDIHFLHCYKIKTQQMHKIAQNKNCRAWNAEQLVDVCLNKNVMIWKLKLFIPG